jgi:nitrous oxidase accessory protein NosD
MYEGETHCDMDSALILDMRWPLDGGNTENADLLFVRDPEGVFAKDTVESFVPDAELPGDAIPTGYEKGPGVELWLANDLSTAYVVDSDTVEAWPALPGWGCA